VVDAQLIGGGRKSALARNSQEKADIVPIFQAPPIYRLMMCLMLHCN
jgi:hypothetical protein